MDDTLKDKSDLPSIGNMLANTTRTRARLVVTISILAFLPACGQVSKGGEVLTSEEMREKLNLSADSPQVVKIDSSKVPADLRGLIPLAEKWGVGDDILRGDLQAKASSEDKAALSAALKGRNRRITEWLDSYAKESVMPDEAAAFMYMQLGLDEMGLWKD